MDMEALMKQMGGMGGMPGMEGMGGMPGMEGMGGMPGMEGMGGMPPGMEDMMKNMGADDDGDSDDGLDELPDLEETA
jgi:hypothetical protein